jgi:hypothetical protein
MIEDNPAGVPDDVRARLSDQCDVDLVEPAEVAEADLAAADVVLLDQRLTHWEERDSQRSISLQPKNGLALAAILRSHRVMSEVCAFCLLAAQPEDLAGGFHGELRGHVLARANGLEWVFGKEETPQDTARRVLALAEAVRVVRQVAQSGDSRKMIGAALKWDEATPWSTVAWNSVLRSQPPLVELEDWEMPMSLLRWMLHRILPYPTFLYGDMELAARLGVEPHTLQRCLEGSSPLAAELRRCEYEGTLRGFGGRRWWRSGVDDLLWLKSERGVLPPRETQNALLSLSGGALEALDIEEPVVCVDDTLQATEIAPISHTVRVLPDDWPAYAAPARALTSKVIDSPRLRLLVADADAGLLETAERAS